ncbi:MAG: DUF4160 domain-containing protein [Acidobacteriota bacterium]|jgi:hypothetical protein
MSPTVFRAAGLRFFFFSREEPRLHIHVIGPSGEAKFWLEPELELAVNYGLSDRTLAKASSLIKEHEDEIHRAWEQHFGR